MIINASNTSNIFKTVKSLGKYLFKNLPSSVDFRFANNTFEIDLEVLYQIPVDIIKTYGLDEETRDVRTLKITISLTSYSNKIRINLIENSEDEKTLGHTTIDMSKYNDVSSQEFFKVAMDKIQKFIKRRLETIFTDYDFLF